jgi:proteasome beta subunit
LPLPLFEVDRDPGPSFVALLETMAPPWGAVPSGMTKEVQSVPHGTTIAAAKFAQGVVMAGDRRATEGHLIANRTIEKVFPADRYSAIAIAGAAGPAVEMVRLFQVQLEHYEKVEGAVLSLEGKANQLAQMIRQHLGMAMQGLAVVPLFGGWDQARGIGRIFTYDVAGGRYEEESYYATGSGGRDARATLKLGYRPGMTREEIVRLITQSLFEAAQEDTATGGPDPLRGIYPVVAVIDGDGYQRVPDEQLAEVASSLEEELKERRFPQ